MDESGLVCGQGITDAYGKLSFSNLLPGKRYHILTDDYTIALTGRSKFQITDASLRSRDDDYKTFYESLTPEERRKVDRIAAYLALKDDYDANSIHRYEDRLE